MVGDVALALFSPLVVHHYEVGVVSDEVNGCLFELLIRNHLILLQNKVLVGVASLEVVLGSLLLIKRGILLVKEVLNEQWNIAFTDAVSCVAELRILGENFLGACLISFKNVLNEALLVADIALFRVLSSIALEPVWVLLWLILLRILFRARLGLLLGLLLFFQPLAKDAYETVKVHLLAEFLWGEVRLVEIVEVHSISEVHVEHTAPLYEHFLRQISVQNSVFGKLIEGLLVFLALDGVLA